MYLPVHEFALVEQGDKIVGYAAPRRGPEAAGVALFSDGAPIYVARASHYLPAAEAKGLRLGWCGFTIHGALQALAVGTEITLRCVASGQILANLDLTDHLSSRAASESLNISIGDLMKMARESEICTDIEHIIPFAEAHCRAVGPHEFLDDSYEMFFQRRTDQTALQILQHSADGFARKVLTTLVSSSEFKDNIFSCIPGPFHSNFRYGRRLLG